MESAKQGGMYGVSHSNIYQLRKQMFIWKRMKVAFINLSLNSRMLQMFTFGKYAQNHSK